MTFQERSPYGVAPAIERRPERRGIDAGVSSVAVDGHGVAQTQSRQLSAAMVRAVLAMGGRK